MKDDFRNVQLTGTLIADVTGKPTKSGKGLYCSGAIAVHENARKADGTPEERAFFVSLSFFASEKYAEYLKKGAVVLVNGRIRGSFVSKSGKVYTDVYADEIKVIYTAKGEKGAEEEAPAAPAAPEAAEEGKALPF